jgi:exopolysaccharide production protein ExoQ
MKIPKAILVSPDRSFGYGLFAVAISFFVFAYSTRLGQLPILAYYALWLPLLVVDPRRYLRKNPHLVWIVAFGAFALLSTFWSAAPGASVRAGVQNLTHIACALIAAYSLNIRTLTLGGLAGVALVLVYSVAVGGYHHDPIDGAYSFVGAFVSKNQLGFFASLGIYFAFAAFFLLRERGVIAMAALLIGTLSAYLLHQSQSATSIITVVIAVAAAIFAYVLQQLAPAPRKFVLVSGIALGILGLLFALQLGAFEAVTGAFGKDATLTGRSYLWAEGMAAFGEDPILGMGYQAYWVHGFPDAERLWDEFYITARTGFHFHNTYIETLVELGVVGLILFVILFAGAAVGFLVRLLEGDRDVSAQLMFGLMAMLFVRSIVEVDLITPYVVGSFLLYYAAGTAHRSVLRTHGEIQPLGRDYRAPPAYRT